MAFSKGVKSGPQGSSMVERQVTTHEAKACRRAYPEQHTAARRAQGVDALDGQDGHGAEEHED